MNKNAETLADFTQYCQENPELRFWQALRNWSGAGFVYLTDELVRDGTAEDTFYREGK